MQIVALPVVEIDSAPGPKYSTIAPVPGRYYRSMHRPPNSASNAFFLEALRLTLVHETTDAGTSPHGLELAYATPRAWLEPGKRIEVRRLQTSFGPLSYSLEAGPAAVRAAIDVLATVGASRALSTTDQQRLIEWASARWSL